MATHLTDTSPAGLGTPIVYVVDPDAAVRESLASLIRSAGWRPRPVGSAEEFLAMPRMAGPSCLITELELPGVSGLELQRGLNDRRDIPIVFLSGCADIQSTVLAMKAGAFEFLSKPLHNALVANALREAIERSRVEMRQRAQLRALSERYESLSRREREVMSLVVSGRINKQVGGDLGISEITVKAHRGKLMRKMRASSFAELVSMALSLGSPVTGCASFAE